MTSRHRLLALLGPPLVAVLMTGLTVRAAPWVLSASQPKPNPLTACRPEAGRAADAGRTPVSTPATTGAWWRAALRLDTNGALSGWDLTFGAQGSRTSVLRVGPASVVAGPRNGVVTVAEDDGTASIIHLVKPHRACTEEINIDGAIARRAVIDPAGGGILVHLLDRETRSDLGIWLVPEDGGARSLVLPPPDASVLYETGIERIWATDVQASADGAYLAVQSCDPETCLTRIQDRLSGAVTSITGGHGAIIGFVGQRLVAMGECDGVPCPVLSFGVAGGPPTEIASAVIAAATSADGLVVAIAGSGPETTIEAIDLESGDRHSLGSLADGALPLAGSSRVAGIETIPRAVGVIRADGTPEALDVGASFHEPATENEGVLP